MRDWSVVWAAGVGHGDCAVAGVATAVGWRDLSDPEP
jgi:hypothetical protein